jgi:hypothetical protein
VDNIFKRLLQRQITKRHSIDYRFFNNGLAGCYIVHAICLLGHELEDNICTNIVLWVKSIFIISRCLRISRRKQLELPRMVFVICSIWRNSRFLLLRSRWLLYGSLFRILSQWFILAQSLCNFRNVLLDIYHDCPEIPLLNRYDCWYTLWSLFVHNGWKVLLFIWLLCFRNSNWKTNRYDRTK